MSNYADLVRETTTTSGTGTYSLLGAKVGHQTFVSGVGSGNEVYYCARTETLWEVGRGTVTSGSPATLTRAQILDGSNGTSPVNWGSELKDIYLVAPALFFRESVQTVGNQTIGGTKTFSSTISGSITGSAATLTTTRTIWGQNFNGSANITGNLTSVGNITGTSAVTLTATSATLALAATGANIITTSTNGTERMRIDSAGSVGIGTTAPNVPLSFGSAVNTAGVVGKLALYDVATAADRAGFGISSGQMNIIAGTSLAAVFYTDGANERMRITSAGNVGIGTGSPAQSLDVVGLVLSRNVLGTITTTAINKTLAVGEFCTATAAGLTITLPASPAAGWKVAIGVLGFVNTIIARNSQNIMGLAENMTIDKANVTVTLQFVDATRGWKIV
jgi:hypothetical protein